SGARRKGPTYGGPSQVGRPRGGEQLSCRRRRRNIDIPTNAEFNRFRPEIASDLLAILEAGPATSGGAELSVRRRRFDTPGLLAADAIQMLKSPQENPAVGKRRRRVRLLTQFIAGYELKLLRIRPKYYSRPFLVGHVSPSFGHDDRAPMIAAGCSVGPHF